MSRRTLAAVASEVDADEFYLPRVAVQEFREPWVPAHTWKMLDPIMRASSGRPATRMDEAKPGRNELCPCQSGKKFKRCCGA